MRLDYFSDSPYSSPDLHSELDTTNPPPTPFSFDDEGFESISGSQTPEQSEAGDRCFLETLVELMPEEEKVVCVFYVLPAALYMFLLAVSSHIVFVTPVYELSNLPC